MFLCTIGGHVAVADGICDTEFGHCMKKLYNAKPRLTTYQEIGQYISHWAFPCGRKYEHLFTDSSIKTDIKKNSFTATCSEMLTLVPILHRYFQQVVLPRNQEVVAIKSMIACFEVVILLLSVRCGAVTPDMLKQATEQYLDLFADAYGPNEMKPKHHYLLHLW